MGSNVTGNYNLYQNPYQMGAFGSLSAKGSEKAPKSDTYYQAHNGFLNPASYSGGLIPTTSDMEKASAILEKGIGVENMHQASKAQNPYASKGIAWDGFEVSKNNGTGELTPNVLGRADEIDDCPWEPYFA